MYISAVICYVSALLLAPVGRSSGSGQSTQLWNCSFEQSADPLCGMTQEQSRDKFDWTIHSGQTESYGTGPDHAHDGRFYAYINASASLDYRDDAWWAFLQKSVITLTSSIPLLLLKMSRTFHATSKLCPTNCVGQPKLTKSLANAKVSARQPFGI